jgi:NAD(P)-dependent dehydrogenase (short-subunit alcohol dehydrogenase family)
MSPSTVLVTGARRFIGGQLAARLADDPMIVRVLAVEVVRPPKSCSGDEMLMGGELARVETIGMPHLPANGAALVVANHSGTLRLDALMSAVAVHEGTSGWPASTDTRDRAAFPCSVSGMVGSFPWRCEPRHPSFRVPSSVRKRFAQ